MHLDFSSDDYISYFDDGYAPPLWNDRNELTEESPHVLLDFSFGGMFDAWYDPADVGYIYTSCGSYINYSCTQVSNIFEETIEEYADPMNDNEFFSRYVKIAYDSPDSY